MSQKKIIKLRTDPVISKNKMKNNDTNKKHNYKATDFKQNNHFSKLWFLYITNTYCKGSTILLVLTNTMNR